MIIDSVQVSSGTGNKQMKKRFVIYVSYHKEEDVDEDGHIWNIYTEEATKHFGKCGLRDSYKTQKAAEQALNAFISRKGLNV